ncbi:unnamed protein product, partial [Ixodes pacificus]
KHEPPSLVQESPPPLPPSLQRKEGTSSQLTLVWSTTQPSHKASPRCQIPNSQVLHRSWKQSPAYSVLPHATRFRYQVFFFFIEWVFKRERGVGQRKYARRVHYCIRPTSGKEDRATA